MRTTQAKEDGWLPALLHTCGCGAGQAQLKPVTEAESRCVTAGGRVLPILLVPDEWPSAGA
ncbi:hypothetical protein [Paracraurococcus lichenis]|uniref:Uncharacterized protein n=1 Tax=Paracraurococcus lichenis TaxID=3064888 RepID=A0ABT9EBP6_9PROT|nr:hypothetical protein [Paracraurococcus sp. LOR1-02]MDO9713634.1 hypothetical protein [Paracraurococcus sp. LOR1-02]